MEATTAEAAPPTAPAVVEGLPPGPRMPRALQTAIWSRQAQWMLEQSRARFGDMFTIRIAREDTWVMLSDPELVKQVFTGDPRIFHAGEGNQILRPILGENSVLVLDEKPHIGQRRLLLPVVLAGPERIRSLRPFRRRIERVDELIQREISERRTAADLAEREDVLSMLVAAPPRGRQPDERR